MAKKLIIRTADGTEVEQDKMSVVMKTLNRWRHREKPKSLAELERRITEFFEFCEQMSIIPSVETCSTAIGVSRVSFNRWLHGQYCSSEWQRTIIMAHQAISAGIETATLEGRLHPATGIFALKAVSNWSDQRSLEAADALSGYGYDTEPGQAPQALLEAYKKRYAIANKSCDDETLSDLTEEVLNVPDDPITLPEWL